MSRLWSSKNDEELGSTSSDDEYDKNEKRLINKFRNKKQEESESETEVFGVGSGTDSDDKSDDDNQSEIALSDVEGQEDNDNLPDVRAWGKEKKKYYGTDYVDPDYGGFQEKDAHAAEIEELEAKNLQQQLVQQLDDNDFSLDVIFKKKDDKVKEQNENEELIKTDLSKLTIKQKIQILQKESPEFFALIEDFKVKMTVARDFLHPIMKKLKKGEIENCKAVEFVQTYYQLILNYTINIYMYLLLKANKELKNHPVIQRLYQYRQLLAQMEPVFEEVMKPQIEMLLEGKIRESTEKLTLSPKPKKKKVLKILAQQKTDPKINKIKTISDSTQPSKKIKLDNNLQNTKKINLGSEHSDEASEDLGNELAMNIDQNRSDGDQKIEAGVEETEGIGKRAITYQIAKNKGLTPHRKKEHRNPRVKHKLKFRKALIRRKGAVREPRKELKRYSGEISGIKTTVSKSVKFKS